MSEWKTVNFTVRRPGCTAWIEGIKTEKRALVEARRANQVAPGHRVYAEQRLGEKERTVEVR